MALHAGGVGRMPLVDAGHAVIEPANYRRLDQDIVVQIGPRLILATVVGIRPVATDRAAMPASIAVYPDHGDSADTLVQSADAAM